MLTNSAGSGRRFGIQHCHPRLCSNTISLIEQLRCLTSADRPENCRTGHRLHQRSAHRAASASAEHPPSPAGHHPQRKRRLIALFGAGDQTLRRYHEHCAVRSEASFHRSPRPTTTPGLRCVPPASIPDQHTSQTVIRLHCRNRLSLRVQSARVRVCRGHRPGPRGGETIG